MRRSRDQAMAWIQPASTGFQPRRDACPIPASIRGQVGATWDSGSSQLMAGGWNQINVKVSSNPKHSGIL